MKERITKILCGLVMAMTGLSGTALAQTKEERLVADASDVVDQLLRIPEQTIPPNLLSRAYAVAVIPDVLKVGFVAGARHGKGVLVVRQDDNSWSNPAFIKLTGGSVGWQIGAQSTDLILVFKTRQYVDDIADGKITLGADASVAAGPVGRYTSAAVDLALEAEVVSYSRSRGLFAGISLEGAGISMDKKANAAFYSSASMTPRDVLASSAAIAPDVAHEFVQLLTRQTSRLPTQPGMRAGDPVTSFEPADAATADEPAVKTYGLPDPEEDY